MCQDKNAVAVAEKRRAAQRKNGAHSVTLITLYAPFLLCAAGANHAAKPQFTPHKRQFIRRQPSTGLFFFVTFNIRCSRIFHSERSEEFHPRYARLFTRREGGGFHCFAT